MVCDAVELFPQSSVAVQVLVTLYSPAQAPGIVTSEAVSVNVLPQASVAVAISNSGVSGQVMVVMPGSGSITGASVSITAIVCDAVDEFPQSSVAVHVLVTLYSPAQAPFVVASEKVNVNALPQASVAVAISNSGVSGQFIVVRLGSASITGASVSITSMVCDAVELLPHSSVAVQVLVILYAPAQAPFVVTSKKVNANALPQPSFAIATSNTGVAGQFITVKPGSGSIIGEETS